MPKSRLEFWEPKLNANRLRDKRNQVELEGLGWKILVVWECELGDKERTKNKLREFLSERSCGQSSYSPEPEGLA